MKEHKRHYQVKRVYRGVWYVLIALLGFIFMAEIIKAQYGAAYMNEEARVMETRYADILSVF